MIGIRVKTTSNPQRVKRAVNTGIFTSLSHAAASISKDMKASFEKTPPGDPSAPGEPPHTHKGAFYRRAVRFHVDKEKQSAIVGLMASVVGEEVGPLHEFGGEREGVQFPARPSAFPALERAIPRFGGEFRGSVGE